MIQDTPNSSRLPQVALLEKAAREFGTPCYVYDYENIVAKVEAYRAAFSLRPTRICYAVKANPSLGILQIMHELGLSFDIVSGGELARLAHLKVPGNKIVFSGVGKTSSELLQALNYEIYSFNCESLSELKRLQQLASSKNRVARVALRIKPNINTPNHPFIATGHKASKFGISESNLPEAFTLLQQSSHLRLVGLSCHIGSQILEARSFAQAAHALSRWAETATGLGFKLEFLDAGGGLGVCYANEHPLKVEDYANSICSKLPPEYELIVEPGRSLVADAGVLLAQVEYLKSEGEYPLCVINAGMNDLLRPSLYQAHHDIVPLHLRATLPSQAWTIVGPICESSDSFLSSWILSLQEGDIVAIQTAGAYGISMSSTYNSRPLPAEVLIKNNALHCLRARPSLESLYQDERIL